MKHCVIRSFVGSSLLPRDLPLSSQGVCPAGWRSVQLQHRLQPVHKRAQIQ